MSTGATVDRSARLSAATRWRLDPAGSTAEFAAPNFCGLITVDGHFNRLDGWLEADPSGRCQGGLTIEAASLDARNPIRVWHLRAADWFDAARYPEMRFPST